MEHSGVLQALSMVTGWEFPYCCNFLSAELTWCQRHGENLMAVVHCHAQIHLFQITVIICAAYSNKPEIITVV